MSRRGKGAAFAGGKGEDRDGAWTPPRISVLEGRGLFSCSAPLHAEDKGLLLQGAGGKEPLPCSPHPAPLPLPVKTWNGEVTVGVQHLKSCDYLPAECEQVGALCDRISRIYSDSLEETVKNLLQSLGKLNRPYLTAVEEKLLSGLESE